MVPAWVTPIERPLRRLPTINIGILTEASVTVHLQSPG